MVEDAKRARSPHCRPSVRAGGQRFYYCFLFFLFLCVFFFFFFAFSSRASSASPLKRYTACASLVTKRGTARNQDVLRALSREPLVDHGRVIIARTGGVMSALVGRVLARVNAPERFAFGREDQINSYRWNNCCL